MLAVPAFNRLGADAMEISFRRVDFNRFIKGLVVDQMCLCGVKCSDGPGLGIQ